MSPSRKLSSALVLATLLLLTAFSLQRRPESSDETTSAEADRISDTTGESSASRSPDTTANDVTSREPGAFGVAPSARDRADEVKGAWIAGTVVDRADDPVPDASVRMLGTTASTTTRAGLDGRFRIPANTGRLHDLRVEARGYGVETRVSIPDGVDDLVIRLDRTVALHGAIRFTDGAAASGARVEARAGRTVEADPFSRRRAIDVDHPAESTATCDRDGAFKLEGLAAGRYFLSASGSGIRAPSSPVLATVERDATPLILTVRRGHAVGGIVVGPDDRGVHDAGIRVVSAARPRRPGSTSRTDATGRFLLDTLPPPPWRVDVHPGGSLRGASVEVDEDSDSQRLRVQLERGRELRGVTVDAITGQPIVGATVSVTSSGRETNTNIAGEFTLVGLEEGGQHVMVRARSYATARVDLDGNGENILTMQRAGRLTGITIDTEKTGVPDVEVELLEWDPDAATLAPRAIATARSAHDGSFEIELGEVRRGPRYSLRARHADFPITELQGIHPSGPTDDHENVVLNLAAAGTVVGAVRDKHGLLVGIPVRLVTSREQGDAELHHVAFSDAEGRFRLRGVRPGTYSIRVDSASHAPFLTSRLVVLSGEESVADLDLAAPRTIDGRVIDPDGGPIRAAIEAIDLDASTIQRGRRSALTDQYGRFVLEGLHRGPYRLRISAPGFATTARGNVGAPAKDLEIVLRPFGSVVGRVVERENGNAVPRFEISVMPLEVGMRLEEPLRPWSVESAEGRFERAGIPPGTFRLTIDAFGFVPGSTRVLVPPGGRSVETLVELERGGETRLSVLDTGGRALPDVRARAMRVQGSRRRGLDASETREGGTTDGTGRLRIRGLRPGRWVIEVEADGYLPARSDVVDVDTEVPGRPPTVLLTLHRGATIRGVARDAQGAPLADGSVVLFGKSRPRSTRVSRDGTFELVGVPSGSYRLQATRRFGDRGPLVDVQVEEEGVTIIQDLRTP